MSQLIFLKPKGGLGNQLFQYAAALIFKQTFDGHIFIFSPAANKHSGKDYRSMFEGYPTNVNIFTEYVYYQENAFEAFDPHKFKYNSITLDGYFQHYPSIKSAIPAIINHFTQSSSIKTVIPEFKEYAFLHIRRGDYVINPIVRKSAVCLSEDSNYYNLAINHIKKAIGDDINLFIFSDDLHWVSENMKFDAKNIQYVEFKNQKKNSHEDMHLMSLCNHNITANSTFSWWGGWMNKNPNKIVTAPLAWTKKDEEFILMNKGLIYDSLILIDYTKNTLQSKKSIL
jgi:hypothetical protein